MITEFGLVREEETWLQYTRALSSVLHVQYLPYRVLEYLVCDDWCHCRWLYAFQRGKPAQRLLHPIMLWVDADTVFK